MFCLPLHESLDLLARQPSDGRFHHATERARALDAKELSQVPFFRRDLQVAAGRLGASRVHLLPGQRESAATAELRCLRADKPAAATLVWQTLSTLPAVEVSRL